MERDSDDREMRTRIAARVCIASHRIDREEIKAGCIRECSEIRNRRRGLGNAGGVGRASSEKNLFLSPRPRRDSSSRSRFLTGFHPTSFLENLARTRSVTPRNDGIIRIASMRGEDG